MSKTIGFIDEPPKFSDTAPLISANDALARMAPDISEKGVGSCNFLSELLGLCCCPFMGGVNYCLGVFTLPVQSEAIILRWGKYERTVQEPGLHYSSLFGRTINFVSTKTQAIDLPRDTGNRRNVLDAAGNPLVVSAVVVYKIVNTFRAAIRVSNAHNFLMTQGEAVLKHVVGMFPYESNDGGPCLKNSNDVVKERLKYELQEKVYEAGILIQSFELKELSYAPVIAAAMLKRQQAAAVVSARQTIVDGAVQIATSAVNQLRGNGIELDRQETTRLVSNLLTVICSDQEAHPTVPLN